MLFAPVSETRFGIATHQRAAASRATSQASAVCVMSRFSSGWTHRKRCAVKRPWQGTASRNGSYREPY